MPSAQHLPGSPLTEASMPGVKSVTFEPLLTTAQAASLLQVHAKTLELWARSKRVPAYNLGRWKFRASELDAWLRGSVHSASANPAAQVG
jgi:excisionase family DNA binding protein